MNTDNLYADVDKANNSINGFIVEKLFERVIEKKTYIYIKLILNLKIILLESHITGNILLNDQIKFIETTYKNRGEYIFAIFIKDFNHRYTKITKEQYEKELLDAY